MADDGVSEFIAVTNSDVDTAKFYLESCNGDVTSAVESYFANNDSHAAAAPPLPSDTTAPPPQPVPPRPRVPSPFLSCDPSPLPLPGGRLWQHA